MKKLYILLSAFFLLSIFNCNDEPFVPELFGSLEGTVIHKDDQSYMPNILVSTVPATSSVLTDENGKFIFESIPTGEYDVHVEIDGFLTEREAVTIHENTTTTVILYLRPRVEENLPPEAPTIVSPADAATGLDINVTLRWEAMDPDPEDSLTFDVLLYSSFDPTLKKILSKSPARELHLENLIHGTTYFWQVVVRDEYNDPINGPLWQFSTMGFPDNRILFSRQVNNVFQIFSGDENGNEVQLTFLPTPSWRPRYNPQRTKIAFIALDGIEKHLYQMKPDGSDIQKITSSIPVQSFDEEFLNFCWSPNGAFLLYTHYNRLYRIAIDGSGLTLISEISNDKSFSYCDWTEQNQGQIMARTSGQNKYDGDIFLFNVEGQMIEQVFNNIDGRTTGGSFSADGSQILMTQDSSGFEGTNGRQLNARIYIRTISSGAMLDLSENKPAGTNDLDPRFSPDGAWIIFTNTNNDGNSVRNIWIMDLEGNRELLFENAQMADWR